MTVYTLREKHLQTHPTSHYFDRDTLRFFGERLSDMRVLKGTCSVKDASGNEHTAYCLSSLQRNAPAGPARHYAYFDSTTFDHILM